jgi:hypothetical protein
MRIPKEPLQRQEFYIDVMQKCLVSQAERSAMYSTLRSYYLFGSGVDAAPAHYNKIYPHIDQLSSFMYSADTTRFSINIGASQPKSFHKMIPALTKGLHDYWLNSNADQVFAQALNWSLCYNSTFVKLVWRNGIHPYMVEPQVFGVLREDTPYTDRQEAVLQEYYMTRSELYSRLYAHPRREEIIEAMSFAEQEVKHYPEGVERLVTSAIDPTIYGNVQMNLAGSQNYVPRIGEPTVKMYELWIFDDEINDYCCVTIAEPRVVIYDRPSKSLFLEGEQPFVQVCPSPQYDYYWGQSETQRLVFLQEMRNKRVSQVLELLDKQVSPPKAIMGFTGILDEKNFALNRAGSFISTDMPNAKVEEFAPNIPNDIFREIAEIDAMFAEASGITSVLSGRGETGVRSQGHASQLARLGSSRAKRRALIVEDSLEKIATLYLKMMQVYDDTVYTDTDGNKFIASQFTNDFVVKVDAHSNSPIFMEDLRELTFNLYNAGAISKSRLVELLEPPMKDILLDDILKAEQQAAAAPPAPPGGAPEAPPAPPGAEAPTNAQPPLRAVQ